MEGATRLLQQQKPAVALLDVQLLDGMITPVAELLRKVWDPIRVGGGYTGPELQKPALANALRVGKPVSEHRLLDALAQLMRTRRSPSSATDPGPGAGGPALQFPLYRALRRTFRRFKANSILSNPDLADSPFLIPRQTQSTAEDQCPLTRFQRARLQPPEPEIR